MQNSAPTTTATYNSDASNQYTFAVNFNQTNPGTAFANFAFNMGVSSTSVLTIENKSTSMFFFDCNGALIRRMDLKESDMTTPNAASYTSIPTTTGSVYTPSSIAQSGTSNTCATGSSQITLTAPSATSYTWFKAPNLGAPQTTVNSVSDHCGLYQVNVTGGCGTNGYAAVIYQTSPIISPDQPSKIANTCASPSSSATLSAKVSSGASALWNPGSLSGATVNVSPTGGGLNTYTLTSSQSGCSVQEVYNVIAYNSSRKLLIRDDLSDTGIEPCLTCGDPWHSPDIYFTDINDNILQNPEYYTNGAPTIVNVLVTNTNTTDDVAGVLGVYWTKAGTAQNWPQAWVNYTTAVTSGTVASADIIGSPSLIVVPSGSSIVVKIPWQIPNYTLFPSYNQFEQGHFCLVARVVSDCGDLASWEGMGNMPGIVAFNSCIAQKNCVVVTGTNPAFKGAIRDFNANNLYTNFGPMGLYFQSLSNDQDEKVTDYGTPIMHAQAPFVDMWIDGGSLSSQIEAGSENTFNITGPDARLDGLFFESESSYDLGMRFLFHSQPPSESEFDFNVIQYTIVDGKDSLIGGQRFHILSPECPEAIEVEPEVEVDYSCTAHLEVLNIDSEAYYEWTESDGTFIEAATSIFVTPLVTSDYIAYVYKNGCYQTATVNVYVNPAQCAAPRQAITGIEKLPENINYNFSLIPNPASDKITVTYSISKNDRAVLIISNTEGKTVGKYDLKANQNSIEIDCRSLRNGFYIVTLQSDQKIINRTKLVISK
jgi:hypothetical protein